MKRLSIAGLGTLVAFVLLLPVAARGDTREHDHIGY